MLMTALAPTLQAFFTDRLALQRQASGHTIAACRDAIKMLIVFAAQRAGKTPSRLDIADLDAQTAGAFLNHLESDRGNSVRTRNARLAAIRSLFQYAALRHPEHAAGIQRVLAIPPKRHDKALITYLTEEEITALLAAPDLTAWTGRRDQALLMLACQTGLRATELTSLTIGDIHLGTGAHVSCLGKGRKQRITPLTPATVTALRGWLAERGGLPAGPLFITRRGTPLTRDALEQRIAKYTGIAAESCPALLEKKVSPHVLRHYVDGCVMWPAAASPLVAKPRVLVPVT
jgi:integrase/recombinase XerD